jgi:hypothetical protein
MLQGPFFCAIFNKKLTSLSADLHEVVDSSEYFYPTLSSQVLAASSANVEVLI